MTTHQLATLLEHLKLGFGDSLKGATASEFEEMVGAFRELPDQKLKDLFRHVVQADNGSGSSSRKNEPVHEAMVSIVIERVRAARAGEIPSADLSDLSRLTAPQLKAILRAFSKPISGTKAALAARIRELNVPSSQPTEIPADAGGSDEKTVEEGVRLFTQLRDDRSLTITDIRNRFESLRNFPKAVVAEISRRLNYTPYGSRTEILDRLLANLEGIKMSQYRMDQILTGT